MSKEYKEPGIAKEYSGGNGSDILNPSEELKNKDGGFYGHMAVGKGKVGQKKAKAKYQRGDF